MKQTFFITILWGFLLLFTFSCAQYFDTEEVAILSFSPAAECISNDSVEIVFNFSAEMDTRSVEGAFSFTEEGEKKPGRFIWSDKCRTLRFIPREKCFYGKEYGFSLRAAAESSNGNDLERDFAHTFQLGADRIFPAVRKENCSPAPGARLDQDRIREPVLITFSEPMYKPYPYNHLTIDPPVEGSWEWLDESGNVLEQFSQTPSRILRFTPLYDYQNRQRYTVTVNRTFTDEKMNELLEPYVFSFYMNQDENTLEVLPVTAGLFTLADSSETYQVTEGIEKDALITLAFTNPMEKSSVENAIAITPAKNFFYRWTSDSALEIYLDEKDFYQWDTIYSFSLKKTAADELGNTLQHEYVYHFKIGGTDSTPPVIQKIVTTVNGLVPEVNLLDYQMTPYNFNCGPWGQGNINQDNYPYNYRFPIQLYFEPGFEIDLTSLVNNIWFVNTGSADITLTGITKDPAVPDLYTIEVTASYKTVFVSGVNHTTGSVIMEITGNNEGGNNMEGVKDIKGNYLQDTITINLAIMRQ